MVPFIVIALLVVLSALGVVILKNPVYAALALISCLLGVAAIFALLDAHFLAAVQVLVYAGAIMVLVIFVLMLLGASEGEDRHKSLMRTAYAVGAGTIMLLALLPLLNLGRQIIAGVSGDTRAVGLVLFNRWVFPFELASLLIMAGLVGAVMLGRRPKRRDEEG
jgi:NADH-quinone oxidoreductase subunit J